ncbi:hypothetical protein E5K00_14050 [Hymenobacter aquaticus]|uniref:Uncharacterized protein n=1 Tax=Hymenobacter aquaticus TaxID=1867101 RepID=A0A4Z0PUJ3_9BACT|nr:hypothetical protein [Hymenobacter aquaticus]TGE21408.1 hypothetical protein E5K00_14050 [Hymenobacter aquaticus]
MKKLLLLAPLLLLLGVLSCKKINELLTFDLDYSQNITVPGSPIFIPTPVVLAVPVTTKSDETFKSKNTAADLVKDVKLKRLALTITDPAAENFDFLNSIEISIGTDQNDIVPLASLSSIPKGVSTIELTPSGAKLDKYLKASSYTLHTKVTVNKAILKDITVRADTKFTVTADPL